MNSKPLVGLAAIVAAGLLLCAPSASLAADDLVFRGTPRSKLESSEGRDVRYELSPTEGKAAEVVIVWTLQGCRWRSRADRPVVAQLSGAFVIFETAAPSASYVKAASNSEAFGGEGDLFMEHVSQALATITYRGSDMELHRPERCLPKEKQ